ncbi:MAG: sigma-70 family RNA polymerase sigma factor [Planctomycetales bacterium]
MRSFRKRLEPLALSEFDRNLLERCLTRQPKSWNDFVDRYMGLIVHIIQHVSDAAMIQISKEDRDDLTAEVFLQIVADDFAVLRQFRGQSSLATYLTVISRRVVVRGINKLNIVARTQTPATPTTETAPDNARDVESELSDREQVERLLSELEGVEADVVRLYHLDGKSYYEISMATGMPENSIGPLLSRARGKLRRAGANPA